MQIFLSYASEDREVAEEIQLALVGSGYHVFFDKSSLPAGGDYHSRIKEAVRRADIFVFLITPNSVAKGSFALTELKYARAKWAHPKEKLVPVLVRPTGWDNIPPYLKAVTVLEPEGNVAAEVLSAVESLSKNLEQHTGQPIESHRPLPAHENGTDNESSDKRPSVGHIWVAIIGLVGVLGGAIIANWQNIFPQNRDSQVKPPTAVGMPGQDTGLPSSPVLNTDCPEITFHDMSKHPPESRIVRICDP